jgi:hypothetical protein
MKKHIVILVLLMTASVAVSQKNDPPTLKSILLEQFKSTHTDKDWFVSVDVAIDGLTPEQANWTDGKSNHSVAQLATHLIFWNETLMAKFNGTEPPKYSGNNEETFVAVDKDSWPATVKKIDNLFTQWEKAIESAEEAKLAGWYSTIAHMGTHNAYHTGQMVVIRKLQGSWDAEKGVK